ncbi:hypothetical protein, partial [Achromobacter insuavis]|uniref:hypothetical protein n=1 Tax=Achromobacter insuavis TaxID=1287735 RepID=UPI00359FC3DD
MKAHLPMDLHTLSKQVAGLPTIMDLAQEMKLIRALMQVPPRHIAAHPTQFQRIVAALALTHTDAGVFELTPATDAFFAAFHQWLQQMRGSVCPELNPADGEEERGAPELAQALSVATSRTGISLRIMITPEKENV